MQTVTVVPIVRLRRATTGWSYRVRHAQPLQAGALVIIPFRKRPTLGIVWDTEESTKATEFVSEVLTTTPLVRAPQRTLIEWLAEEGICSLSTALYAWMPAALRGFPLTKPVRETLASWDNNQPSPQALALTKQHAVLVPSRREEAERSLQQKYGPIFHSTFEDSTPAQEFITWSKIARGDCTVVTGRERALFAPWINLRHITVIEPEDISYHTGQTPYINLVDAARTLGSASRSEITCRTQIPLAAAESMWPEAAGLPLSSNSVELTDLRHDRMINDGLIQAIQESIIKKEHVLLLYNAHDRLQKQEDGTRKIIPGIETLSRTLATALQQSDLGPYVHLGTRAMLHTLPRPVGLSVILSLDPLLGATSFADQLHGWGDIGRLLQTGAPLVVQTWQPQHDLPQALLRGTFSQYCIREISHAQEAGLPPFTEHIVCALPTDKDGSPRPDELATTLRSEAGEHWQVGYPRTVPRRGKDHTIVTLHAPKGTRIPLALRRTLAALPRPWKVERGPWYAI